MTRVFSGVGRFFAQKRLLRVHQRVSCYNTCPSIHLKRDAQPGVDPKPYRGQLGKWGMIQSPTNHKSSGMTPSGEDPNHSCMKQHPTYSFTPDQTDPRTQYLPTHKHPSPYTSKPYCTPLLSSRTLPHPTPFTPALTSSNPLPLMANFSDADEALIMRFAGLQTGEVPPTSVQVPLHAASSTDWSLCVFAKVISDRTSMDSNFIRTMQRAWGVDPCTVIRPIAKNCYLVELCNDKDKAKVLSGGVWTYQGDLVATR